LQLGPSASAVQLTLPLALLFCLRSRRRRRAVPRP
jgi:hypothetical protein